ncbi:MAG: site-specific integrase, partial [Nitrospirales bacterium]|nr:site-specific integrase [Nitrospirales bacterium]
MARKDRKDRGLIQRTDKQGKLSWYVRLYHEGQERRFGAFPSKTKAREFYEKAKTEQKEARFFPELHQVRGQVKAKIVIDTYWKQNQMKRSARDQEYFANWWKERLKDMRVSAITRPLLSTIRQELLDGERSPQRVNRYLAWLRACLNHAIMDGHLKTNPVKKMMFKEPPGRMRLVTPEEEAKLLEEVGPTYAPWVRLAILTGMRQGEQFSLQWKDVDLERGILILPQTKAGGVQYVYLNDEAKAILRGFDSWQRSKWVFPCPKPVSRDEQNQKADTHVDPRKFYSRTYLPAMKRVMEKTGMGWTSWHDLRHCYASRLAMSGASLSDIAALLR